MPVKAAEATVCDSAVLCSVAGYKESGSRRWERVRVSITHVWKCHDKTLHYAQFNRHLIQSALYTYMEISQRTPFCSSNVW